METHEHAVAGAVEVVGSDRVGVAAHGDERGLVDEVGQVGAAHAGRAPRHDLEVDVAGELFAFGVHLEDLDSFLLGGQWDHHLPIEPASAEQRGVEDVGPVRRRQDDDAFGHFEAVHLGEELVEGLLALVLAAAEPGAAFAADGVDLVDEHDARVLLSRGVEQVPHVGRAHADEHLEEL